MLMTSEDSAQNSVQPMMRPEWLSMMAFSIPSVCCKVRARGSAEAGRRDTLKEYPRLMASSSVSPTCESGGSINTEYATGLRSSAVRSLFPKGRPG